MDKKKLVINNNRLRGKYISKVITNNGELEINGGTLESENDSTIIENNDLLNIKNGRILNHFNDSLRQNTAAIKNNENGTINVTGGYLYSDAYAHSNNAALFHNYGELNISDGTFDIGRSSGIYAIKNFENAVATITEGNFTSTDTLASIFHNSGTMTIENIESNYIKDEDKKQLLRALEKLAPGIGAAKNTYREGRA